MTFKIGDWVRSIRVGNAPSFVGQIVASYETTGEFVVRDDWRQRWVRHHSELQALEGAHS